MNYEITPKRYNFDTNMRAALAAKGVSSVRLIQALNAEQAALLIEKGSPTQVTSGGKASFSKKDATKDRFGNSVVIKGNFKLREGATVTLPLQYEDFATRYEQLTKHYNVIVDIPVKFNVWLANFTKDVVSFKLKARLDKETDKAKISLINEQLAALEQEFLVPSSNVA